MLQNSAQNGMLGSPNANISAQKKNILKRKNIMQPNQQFMLDQQPPNKQPFLATNPSEMMPQNHYVQQAPGTMYQMGQTQANQNGNMHGNSPQFSSTSPMSNHLSPYGG